jgi:hypothetical protein
MCLDLNKIVSYGDVHGSLREPCPENRKRHYVLVDGIVAGQGRGPLNPDPFPVGTVLFGVHPPSVDAACAYLMGFDPDKIPIVSHAFQCKGFPLSEHGWRDVALRSNYTQWNGALAEVSAAEIFHFEPHFGWKGHIEQDSKDIEAQAVEARS